MIFNTLGFATFGLGVRAFQLGLLRRPVASGPVAYLLSAAGFGAFGYLADGWEDSQRELIAEKQGQLRQRREERNAVAA
ncbi:hypothetical protein FRC04_011774 [Tulasnella sp. 424]|nr:hypothetical protein FRC04_011774 [Tulasnella sp. 424]KAG8978119.1 hypothetical protein FRC05_011235 [Tulasnella sp. 425]